MVIYPINSIAYWNVSMLGNERIRMGVAEIAGSGSRTKNTAGHNL